MTHPLEDGDRHHAAHRALPAYRAYAHAMARETRSYEACWKAGRAAFILGVLSDGDEEDRQWMERAEAHLGAALEIRPGGPDAHEWMTAVLGRRTAWEGVSGKVRLAEEIRTHAETALATDPEHAGAHHALGQWHAAILRLDAVARFAARSLFGAVRFEDASWEAAEHHLRRAVELDRDNVLFRMELGRLLSERDRAQEARTHLEAAVTLPLQGPADFLARDAARELLHELS
jgi:tetratricopeptide (TPR) repeat protein